jgi:hypothetical protein
MGHIKVLPFIVTIRMAHLLFAGASLLFIKTAAEDAVVGL